jgi:orotidine-5'-phosphate decarboxylase
MTEEHPARSHLVLALDVDTVDEAVALVRRLRPWFGVAKVGLQLFSAAGPAALAGVRDEGVAVFADLKLHDIPTTVGRAAAVIGRTGAAFLTTHTSGGLAMVRAAVEGVEHGAAVAGHPAPVTLGVTVLTSDPDSGPEVLAQRVAVAVAAKCRGLVCAVPDAARARTLHPRAVILCPGIRPAGASRDDQARVADPAAAIEAGADLLVLGRAVTHTPAPESAAAAAADEVAAALARLGPRSSAPSGPGMPGDDRGAALG